MDKARPRPTIRIGPLYPPLPALKDEHCTPAECRKDFGAMLKDALNG
ncbi:MAG: hypothetical protein JWR80_9473 [Bradyrhizobium sp.]|nr:hypothetical protein [Bradyrhizobium sp.]